MINETGYPDNHMDPETGELFDAPPAPSDDGPVIAVNMVPPPRSSTFLASLEGAIAELPIWITKDRSASIEGRGARTQTYATLKAILQTVRPVLLRHNIRIRQGADHCWSFDSGTIKGKMVPVYTDLIFSPTGEVDRTIIEIPISRLDAQSMGSAVSYGRRYTLLAALGLATDDEETDDDGASTKAKNVLDEHEESQELWVLRSELEAITEQAKLAAWTEKLVQSKRADHLAEVEQELLRQHFKAAKAMIASQPEKKK